MKNKCILPNSFFLAKAPAVLVAQVLRSRSMIHELIMREFGHVEPTVNNFTRYC